MRFIWLYLSVILLCACSNSSPLSDQCGFNVQQYYAPPLTPRSDGAVGSVQGIKSCDSKTGTRLTYQLDNLKRSFDLYNDQNAGRQERARNFTILFSQYLRLFRLVNSEAAEFNFENNKYKGTFWADNYAWEKREINSKLRVLSEKLIDTREGESFCRSAVSDSYNFQKKSNYSFFIPEQIELGDYTREAISEIKINHNIDIKVLPDEDADIIIPVFYDELRDGKPVKTPLIASLGNRGKLGEADDRLYFSSTNIFYMFTDVREWLVRDFHFSYVGAGLDINESGFIRGLLQGCYRKPVDILTVDCTVKSDSDISVLPFKGSALYAYQTLPEYAFIWGAFVKRNGYLGINQSVLDRVACPVGGSYEAELIDALIAECLRAAFLETSYQRCMLDDMVASHRGEITSRRRKIGSDPTLREPN